MSPRLTGADAWRRWRARAARVPTPLAALTLLFVLSLAIVGLQLAQGGGQDGSRPVAESVSGFGSSIGSAGPEAGDGVLPGEVQAPTLAVGEPQAEPSAEPLPEPERIRVPAMDLDERLIDLGIARDGTMQVPADPDRVGWFAGGARPGGPGPVVVAAHVDSLEGPAVFARLSEVGEGDEVLLDTADGTATYVVTSIRAVPRDDFPTAEVFGATRGDVVRLITCHGPYDRGGIGYTENLVVTAKRV